MPPPSRGRGAVYHLSPELYQARAWLERRVPRLRNHFKTHDTLTNTDYRTVFKVTRYAAVRELRRLTDEKFLKLVGERRGAHYIPGPKLQGPSLK